MRWMERWAASTFVGVPTRFPILPPSFRCWASLALVCLWASAAIVYPAMTKYPLYEPGLGGERGDTGEYVHMYQGKPLREVLIPFRYRVFTPFMARLVPSAPKGLLRYFEMSADKRVAFCFGMVNLLGLAVAGLLMVGLCEALGFNVGQGLLGALLFYTSFPVLNYAGAPMVEAWAWAFLLLGIVAVLRGTLGWLCVAGVVGMLAKETTLLLIAVVLLVSDTATGKLKKLAALAPGLVIYGVFRFVFFAGGPGFSSNPISAYADLMSRFKQGPYLWWIVFEGSTAFGLLCPLAALGAWTLRGAPRSPLMRLSWLVPGILLVPLVNALGMGSGIGRIWFYSFPAMIPLTLVGLERLVGGFGTKSPRAP